MTAYLCNDIEHHME